MPTLDLKRPVPLWLFIAGLLLVSSVTAAVLTLPRLLVQPNFEIFVSPSSANIRPETLLSSPLFGDPNASETLVEVRSMNGFTGTVSLSISSPSGVQAKLEENKLLLGSDAAIFGLNVTTRMIVAATGLGNYSVTVIATGGPLEHSSVFAVRSQDLGIQINPTSLTIAQGSSAVSMISISSLNGYTGNASLSIAPLFNEPDSLYFTRGQVNASLSSSEVVILSSAPSNVRVSITVGDFARPACYNCYNFSVVITYGRFTVSQNVLVSVTVEPEPPPILLGYTFSSDTNASLVLRNKGAAAIQISSYNVTDSSGDWVSPCLRLYPRQMVVCYPSVIVDAGGTADLNVLTNPTLQCDTCALHGNPFTYQVGQSYTIAITTTRQNTFTFKVTR